MVYLLTFSWFLNVGKHTIHGWYGFGSVMFEAKCVRYTDLWVQALIETTNTQPKSISSWWFFTNPSEKISDWKSSRSFGVNIKKYLSCHHPDLESRHITLVIPGPSGKNLDQRLETSSSLPKITDKNLKLPGFIEHSSKPMKQWWIWAIWCQKPRIPQKTWIKHEEFNTLNS